MLDAQEYLHLAVNASNKGDHHAAMEYLHNCLGLEPEMAFAHYLLAAEHAEIGLFDRAIAGIEGALALDPGIEMASFQLGLLYINHGQERRALSVWRELSQRTVSEWMRLFCDGLVSLAEGNIVNAREQISKGLELNDENPAVSHAVEAIIEAAEAEGSDGEVRVEVKGPEVKEPEVEGSALYLGAYKDSRLSED